MADKTGREKKFDKKSYTKKLEYLRGLDNPQRIRFLQRIPDLAIRERMAAEIPGFESWWEANRNMPGGGREGGLGHKSTSGSYNVPTQKKEQSGLQNLAIEQFQKGLPELLERLRTPYTSPMRSQMEEMFGHLQNPILQGLINPQAQNQARGALFPSEIEQEYMMSPQYQESQQGPMGNLLSALGGHLFKQHAVPYLNNLQPQDIQNFYNQAEQLPGQAYEYARESRPFQALSALGNMARHPLQRFQDYADYGMNSGVPESASDALYKMGGAFAYPFAHPIQSGKAVGTAAFDIGQMGINKLLNYLRKE